MLVSRSIRLGEALCIRFAFRQQEFLHQLGAGLVLQCSGAFRLQLTALEAEHLALGVCCSLVNPLQPLLVLRDEHLLIRQPAARLPLR